MDASSGDAPLNEDPTCIGLIFDASLAIEMELALIILSAFYSLISVRSYFMNDISLERFTTLADIASYFWMSSPPSLWTCFSISLCRSTLKLSTMRVFCLLGELPWESTPLLSWWSVLTLLIRFFTLGDALPCPGKRVYYLKWVRFLLSFFVR